MTGRTTRIEATQRKNEIVYLIFSDVEEKNKQIKYFRNVARSQWVRNTLIRTYEK